MSQCMGHPFTSEISSLHLALRRNGRKHLDIWMFVFLRFLFLSDLHKGKMYKISEVLLLFINSKVTWLVHIH